MVRGRLDAPRPTALGRKGARPASGTRKACVRAACASSLEAALPTASAHLFGAVCPERDTGVALVMPEVSTGAMNLFLAELGAAVPAGTHALLVLDRAGWHLSRDLVVPANLTLVHLPPYSPELVEQRRCSTVENVWLYLRERWLSHRVFVGGYEAVVDAACAAWNALRGEPGRLRSLTSHPWLPRPVQTA
jgi:hypothetical protein